MLTIKTTTLALIASAAFAFSGAALAADPAATGAPGQTKAAGQPAAPAAKTAAPGQAGTGKDNLGQTVSAECAKLADPKAKDDCVKKAQAAAGTTTGSTTGAAGAATKTKPN